MAKKATKPNSGKETPGILARVQELKDRAEAATGAPARVIVDEGGTPVKVILFSDEIEAALSETLQTVVSHPQGNVDDETYWPHWSREIVALLARKTGVQDRFVFASFHKTDRLGQAFDDSNMIRVTVKVGDQVRHAVLVDPTPED